MYNFKSKEFWHWIISLVLLGAFIYCRRFQIITDQLLLVDKIVIPVFIALFILPLISEFSFLGISLKKDIKDAKQDITESIHNLQISMNNRVDSHISINNTPSPDSTLQEIQDMLHNVLRDKNLKEDDNNELNVPEENVLLFKYRFEVEKEIRRIWRVVMVEDDVRYPIIKILDVLVKLEVIPLAMKSAVREIYSITSSAIHGGKITQNQIQFTKETGNEILAYLRATMI